MKLKIVNAERYNAVIKQCTEEHNQYIEALTEIARLCNLMDEKDKEIEELKEKLNGSSKS